MDDIGQWWKEIEANKEIWADLKGNSVVYVLIDELHGRSLVFNLSLDIIPADVHDWKV